MNTDHLIRRVVTPAFRDRERDILDARWDEARINPEAANAKALKLLTELYQDYHEAHATLRTVTERN